MLTQSVASKQGRRAVAWRRLALLTALLFSLAALLWSAPALLRAAYAGGQFIAPLRLVRAAEPLPPVALQVGTWTATASMPTARFVPAVSLLPSGKVLVVGGYRNAQNSFSTAAELYDPAMGLWASAPSLPKAHRLTAQLLNNGKVLVVGDDDFSETTPSSYLFTETPAGWAETAGAPVLKRYSTTLTLLNDGRVLMAAGYNGGSQSGPSGTFNTTELYNPSTDMWTAGPPLTTTRNGHTATLLPAGQVLVAGGAQRDPVVARASAELFNGTAWTATGALNAARFAHTATLLPSGKVLVGGGTNGTAALNSVEIYDSGVWTNVMSLKVARSHHTATLLPSGKVLVAGGQDSSANALDSAELYDPATNTWVDAGPLSLGARKSHVAAPLPCGRVLIAGGLNQNNTDLASAEFYTQVEPTITFTPDTLPAAQVGTPYNQPITVNTACQPAQVIAVQGNLPPGVTLQGLTLAGTPTQSGTYTFTITVRDACGCVAVKRYTIQVNCPPITLAPTTLANGTAGVNYGPVNLTVTGGMGPYTFAVTGGLLPMMVTLSSTGQLTGVPMQTGTFPFTVSVTDKFGCPGVRNYTLTIECATITSGPANATLPDAMQGMNYNPAQPPQLTFTATGGCGQNVFTLSGGTLPAGMTLASSGALTGTPTQNGDFEFTVKVTDKCGCMATKVYKLKVTCPSRSLLNRELFNTGVNGSGALLPTYASDMHYLGALPNFNPVTPLALTPFGGWLVDAASPSQWISPFANYFGAGGNYFYDLTFPLDTCDPSTVFISGRWLADNSGQILLNGTLVPGSTITGNTGHQQWQSFIINTGFSSGLNTIRFVVNNEGGSSVSTPTGLRVEFIRATAKCCECLLTPPANLVAWWPLDEPKGATVVNDLSGGQHGKPQVSGSVGSGNTPTAITGVVAGAFNFGSPLQQVSVPHAATLDFGLNGFAIDAWIRTGQAGASVSKVIVEKFEPPNRGYSFRVEANKLVLRLGDGASVQTFMSSSNIAFGPWQFAAVTIDRTAQTVRFHLGNDTGTSYVTEAPQPIPAGFLGVNNNANLRLGGNEISIDEVELFRRALPGTEFRSIWEARGAGKCKPCVRPKITLNPVSLNLCPNKPAVFTAAASGSPTPVVQWQCSLDNGTTWTNLANATGTTLVIAPGAVKHGAKYRAIFTNACCEATTAAAMLSVIQPPLACLEVVNPGHSIERLGGRGSISVVLPPGTPLTATSNAAWLTIDEPGAPASFAAQQTDVTGLVNYTAAANGGAAGRVGALRIGGQNFTVLQAGDNPVVSVSAARFGTLPTVAGDSILAAFGVGLATATQAATSVPLPTTLAGTQVRVLDAAGVERLAPLFFVSAGQVNYLLPAGSAVGPALVTVTAGDGKVSTGVVEVNTVAPGLFTANSNGRGVPAANALLFRPDGSFTSQSVARVDAATNRFVPAPLDLGPENNRLFLILFGTGVKGRTALAAVTARLGGVTAPVSFAGAQGGFVGLDQINVEVPRDLAGRGEVEVELTVDGQTTNVVTINIR